VAPPSNIINMYITIIIAIKKLLQDNYSLQFVPVGSTTTTVGHTSLSCTIQNDIIEQSLSKNR